jgi:hypothetical protein
VKIFTYRFTYKEPFWRQKDTKSYVKVHKGTFMELSDSHKISQEKRDFKISDVLITGLSRVQVLPGPPNKKNPNLFPIGEGFGFFVFFGFENEGSRGRRKTPIPCHRP